MCKVFLPELSQGRIRLVFSPTKDQARKLAGIFELSVAIQVEDDNHQPQIHINCDRAVSNGLETNGGLAWTEEHSMEAEAYDLSIIEFLDSAGSQSSSGAFWITKNSLLSPRVERRVGKRGKFIENLSGQLKIRVLPNVELKFTQRYSYLSQRADSEVRVKQLYAEFKDWTGPVEQLRARLDDLLLLASFAAGSWTVCTGWKTYSGDRLITCFRRFISLPESTAVSHREAVIPSRYAHDFLKHAYRRLPTGEIGDLAILAVAKCIRGRARPIINDAFISNFSALETIVLYYKKLRKRERTIKKPTWKVVSAEIKNSLESILKKQRVSPRARDAVLDKIGELNRLPFATAFKECTAFVRADLSDLWPVVGHAQPTLMQIRNKMVHGVHIPDRVLQPLMVANLHLQWTVERLLLGLFRWPVEKSEVSRSRLAGMNGYRQAQARLLEGLSNQESRI
jgi:hypothetical protein